MISTFDRAALMDFVAAVIWPGRTLAIASSGQTDFVLRGSWQTATDLPMAWINGNRVNGAITWLTATSIRLPVAAGVGDQVIILVSPGSGSGYLPRNPGAATMLGNLNLNGNRVTNAGASVAGSDLVRRDEVAAIVGQLIGANYVLKTGDTMSGTLGVAAATASGHAVRQDQVPLLSGAQPFTAEQKGVNATNPTGLTTLQQVQALVSAVPLPPTKSQTWATPGTYTLTVGTDIPATVTRIWVGARGAKGGNGGSSTGGGGTTYNGGLGAQGGIASGSMSISNGDVITIVVPGQGANGAFGTYAGSGGGGGGGCQASAATGGTVNGTITAGGGGGGSGGNGPGGAQPYSGAGGAGGVAGGAGETSSGGAAGGSITAGGGTGGVGVADSQTGLAGSVGSAIYTGNAKVDAGACYLPPADTAMAVIRWYEA